VGTGILFPIFEWILRFLNWLKNIFKNPELHFEMVEARHYVSGVDTLHERSIIRVKMFIRNSGKNTTIRKIRIVNMNPDYLAKQLKIDTKSFEIPEGKDRECDEFFSFYGTMFAGVDSIELDLEFTHTEGIKLLHVISRARAMEVPEETDPRRGRKTLEHVRFLREKMEKFYGPLFLNRNIFHVGDRERTKREFIDPFLRSYGIRDKYHTMASDNLRGLLDRYFRMGEVDIRIESGKPDDKWKALLDEIKETIKVDYEKLKREINSYARIEGTIGKWAETL